MKDFICENCGKHVINDQVIGTAYRNHCPFCLWSKHLGQGKPNNKIIPCHKLMEPIGLTFKQEGYDKFTGKPKQGEIMIVHECLGCGHTSINRIAGDDSETKLLELLNSKVKSQKSKLQFKSIKVLSDKDEGEVRKQLFGK
jgi:hypothetical protein